MKRVLFAFAVCFLAAAHSSHAQLVHLTLNSTVTDLLGGGEIWGAVGSPATLELNYDSALAPAPVSPGDPIAVYSPPAIAANSWRLRFGTLDVVGAVQSITVSDTTLWFDALDLATYTTLNVELHFASDVSPGLSLPTPPLPALVPKAPEGGLTGYISTISFDTLGANGSGEGTLLAGVNTLAVTGGGGGPVAAVPEPSAFALAGAAALIFIAVRRRRSAVAEEKSRDLSHSARGFVAVEHGGDKCG